MNIFRFVSLGLFGGLGLFVVNRKFKLLAVPDDI
jgi:hypothetical protein